VWLQTSKLSLTLTLEDVQEMFEGFCKANTMVAKEWEDLKAEVRMLAWAVRPRAGAGGGESGGTAQHAHLKNPRKGPRVMPQLLSSFFMDSLCPLRGFSRWLCMMCCAVHAY
jgi:hypothetical protein